MLKSLQIRNYVLIDSLDVDFPESLVIITGQTGAGKSILLGALSLVLGGKADASSIGPNAGHCVVEAVFEVPDTDSSLKAMLDENDVDRGDGELVIRRVIAGSGRSRAFINDAPVNLQTLQAISSRLVDIHSQHQTLMLTDHAFQLSMLDHYAGNEPLLGNCGTSFRKLKSLESELAEVSSKLSRLDDERDYVRSRWQRLEDAGLHEGELESLEAEQKQLANAGEIKENLSAVEEAFSPSDPSAGGTSLSAALKSAQKHLEKVGKYVPDALELASRVESSRMELDDIYEEVVSLNAGIELSQERLDAVETRLALLYDLLKKYSVNSIGELIAARDALSAELFDSTTLEERAAALQREIAAEREVLAGICQSLHEARAKAAKPFAATLCRLLRDLELDHATFEVEVEEAPVSAEGSDSVRFLFSAAGGRLADVGKCASGGELSRLMLSLKALMAEFMNMPTLFFDEIDSGVSGSVADKMGQMICRMGRNMQIFAITHLPQVAAKGSAHYLVEKEYDAAGLTASTSIRRIDGEDRVMELARMLSGSRVTTAAKENARSLLLSDQPD